MNKPAPGPIIANPVAKARLLRKYLGSIVMETKYKQQLPKPNARPNVKYISVKLGTWDVTRRLKDDKIPPLIATLRWLNRSQRNPTNGPKRLPDAYAREPTQATEIKTENKE